ncbi:MAG: BMP family ABC transporter substrate-binding protein [Ruminococcaceae bacterium]|nr:BMP family ABC transporter substrate-binding protein [Oscillospiraceae bacterium]
MRRLFGLLMSVLLVVLLLAACTGGPSASLSLPENSGMTSDAGVPPASADIALITTEARYNDDFGQAVWSTITRFSGETGLAAASYKTEEDNPDACLATLELAVKGGAQMVIGMGESVSPAIATAQAQYPDVYFILLDAKEAPPLLDNGVSVVFSAGQAGWLAGYYAAREANGRLGIVATDSHESQQYTLGFLMGAQASLAALEVAPEPLQVSLLVLDDAHYNKRRTYIDQLYEAGVQLMFAAAPELWQAALPTAQGMGYQLMGIGLPMADTGDAGLASIEADPKNLVYNLLDAWANQNFPGGNEITGGVAAGDITVVTEPWRFKRMPQWLRKRGLESFDSGMLAISIATRLRPDANGNLPTPADLPLELLRVHLVDPDAPIPDPSSVAELPDAPPAGVASQGAPPPESPAAPESAPPPESTPEPESAPAPESSTTPESSSASSSAAASENPAPESDPTDSSVLPDSSIPPDNSAVPEDTP